MKRNTNTNNRNNNNSSSSNRNHHSTSGNRSSGNTSRNEWVPVSVRRNLYDAIHAFVAMREDNTITNISQFVDLAIRAKLERGVILAQNKGR